MAALAEQREGVVDGPVEARRRAPRASPTSVIHASSTSGSRVSARSTSRALTLPEPSHTEFSGASR